MASAPPRSVVSFLEVDGKVISGEAFDEYCKSHGLCRRCARVRTHRRIVKLFGKGKKWEPLTIFRDDDDDDDHDGNGNGNGNSEEYLVYKGYCMQPTCYTMGQAKRLLGEGANSSNGRRSSRRNKLSRRLRKRRPSKRTEENEESSVSSDVSTTSSRSSSSILSNLGQRFRRGGRQKRRSTASSTGSAASSVSSMDFSDDDTIDSRLSSASTTGDASSALSLAPGQVSPIVEHRLEQLIMYDYFTVLDLSKVELRVEEIASMTKALEKATTLESVILDRCKLQDEGLETIVQALLDANHVGIRKLSLRQNTIGNRGALALAKLLRQSALLEELDLSENTVSSVGAVAIFSALHHVAQNLSPNNVSRLVHLNLAQNEIWDLDDGSLLRNTKSLQILNLDGNFMHDEGADQIATSISENPDCRLEKLFLGWNGISDDGATALSKMLEVNQTIQVLGLAENDISNTGARAILSALSINTSVREISGLYHNQIDRKFIIVAIKRLLHRYGDRNSSQQEQQAEPQAAKPAQSAAVPDNKDPQEQHPAPTQPGPNNTAAQGETQQTAGADDASQTSDNSLNWAAQVYTSANVEERTDEPPYDGYGGRSFSNGGMVKNTVALEAIEHWDWGTFGIEEIDGSNDGEQTHVITTSIVPPVTTAAPSLQMPDMDDDDDDDDIAGAYDNGLNYGSGGAAPDGTMPKDRLTIFQSAPLAYFNMHTAQHHAVPLMDFEYERQELRQALEDPEILGSEIELKFEVATADRLQNFFANGDSPIMHFSGYGNPDCFALENGFGYMKALPTMELNRYISGTRRVQVVVVSAHHSRSVADAFIQAGIPHVVCCQTDAAYRDSVSVEFTKLMYQELARNSTLQAAFRSALDGVTKSPLVKNVRNLADKFKLLPEHPPSTRYHDVPVLFRTNISDLPDDNLVEEPDTSWLPPVPSQFLGREVDMYEILESLRVDDVVRVGGVKGSGKASVISAVSRYVLARPASFMISNVFWLPAVPDVTPEEDSLYGDLCHIMSLLLKAEEDIWEEEDYSDTRERIMVELEDQKSIFVVDGRHFTTEASGENLERFLGYLLNEASVKVILVTATDNAKGGAGRTRTSRSEETMVSIGALDFQSSALLFGSNCQFVKENGTPAAYTAEEFASVLVPPSIANCAEPSKNTTLRQQQLYLRVGNGNPKNIIDVATVIPESDFTDILRIAQRPEVHVDSSSTLEIAVAKYAKMKDKAIRTHNYRRATDLADILKELDDLKANHRSLADLISKERELKRELATVLSKREYDEANVIKRKLLTLKRTIMKEKNARQSAVPDTSSSATAKLEKLKMQMDNMLAMAERMKMEKSLTELDASQKLEDDSESAAFAIKREDHTCMLHIKHGNPLSSQSKDGASGLVVWTNEACDLTVNDVSKDVLTAGGMPFTQDLSTLPAIMETEWGPVKVGTGEALMVGPKAYGTLSASFVILAVSPLSPSNDDDDWDKDSNRDEDALHFLDMTLRSSYRSSFGKINTGAMASVVIPMITTRERGEAYERSLRVSLQSIIDEAKFSNLKHVHLVANSPAEATKLIKMVLGMGLACTGTA